MLVMVKDIVKCYYWICYCWIIYSKSWHLEIWPVLDKFKKSSLTSFEIAFYHKLSFAQSYPISSNCYIQQHLTPYNLATIYTNLGIFLSDMGAHVESNYVNDSCKHPKKYQEQHKLSLKVKIDKAETYFQFYVELQLRYMF